MSLHLSSFQWLYFHSKIQYKTSDLFYMSLSGSIPKYLSDLIYVYTPPIGCTYHLIHICKILKLIKAKNMSNVNIHLFIIDCLPGICCLSRVDKILRNHSCFQRAFMIPFLKARTEEEYCLFCINVHNHILYIIHKIKF